MLVIALDACIYRATGLELLGHEIARTEQGRDFLAAWDVVSTVIAAYGITRVVLEAPQVFRRLREAFQRLRGAGPDVSGSAMQRIEREVDEVLEQADEAGDAAAGAGRSACWHRAAACGRLHGQCSARWPCIPPSRRYASRPLGRGCQSTERLVITMKKTSTSIEVSTLPGLAEWAKADPQVTPLTWLHGSADIQMAVAFTALFWPDLVEHDGGVFLQESFNPEFHAQWKAKLGDDVSAIERVMNHRHVGDLLPGADRVGFANLQHLGHVLAATWRTRLADAFPERQFEVSCNEDLENEEVTVTFSQATAGAGARSCPPEVARSASR